MTERTHAVPLHRSLVDGRWVGEASSARSDPSGSGEIVATVAEAGPDVVRAAGDAARRAFPGWSAMPSVERGRILAAGARALDARRDEIARLIRVEEGKTLAEASVEVARAVDYLAFFAAEGWHLGGETLASEDPRQTIMTVREPLGVVAAITPWNFPLAIPAWKLAPALVAGNTVVLKPAALAAGPAVALAEALVEAGLPDGVLNIVQGEGAVVGEALVDHPELDALTFTGSNRVGGMIATRLSGRPVRLQTELGGVNALVVMADADLDVAADLAVRGAFGLTGQACTATRQVLCEGSALDDFLERLRPRTTALNRTSGAMGPAVSDTAAQQIRASVERAVAAGARVVVGDEHGSGALIGATVLADLSADAPLLHEEVFGPVLAVVPVDGLDDAIARINDSPFGLSAGIVTSSLPDAMTFAHRVRVGTVKVNRTTTGNQPNIPFGGVKASSNGFAREQGREALQFFSRTKSIYLGW